MERARVNGVELEYELKGWGEPVLLIHGSHVADSFVPLVAQPSLSRSYLLVRYHRRGFMGSSSPRGPISIEDQAADARALLQHLSLAPVHVVGHSYGGPIALQLAHDAPEAVHSLVLLEAALLSVPRGTDVKRLVSSATGFYNRGDWEVAIDAFLGGPRDRAAVSRNVPGGLEQAIRDIDTFFTVEHPAHEAWQFGPQQGQRIKQPVLFVLGQASSGLYRQCHDFVKAWMPQTETAELPDATHLLHMQNPEGAASILLGFFNRHPIIPAAARAQRRGEMSVGLQPAARYNAASDLLDRNLEVGRSEKVAIRTASGDWTYGEVAAAANRLGNALRGLGLEAENRVLMVMLDSPEFAATFLGTIKVGGVPVPVNTNLTADAYAFMLRDCRAKIAVVSGALADVVREARRQARYPKHLVVVGEPERDELSYEEISGAAGEHLSPADTTVDDMCYFLYTSGTTGRPKGVVHLQPDMRFCFDHFAAGVLGMNEADVTFSVSKLYFSYGLGNSLHFPFAAGATSVLLADPPTPRVALESTSRFHPTLYFAVPTSYANTLSAPDSVWRSADFSSVRICVSAGEPLPGAVLKHWKERTGVDILDGLGATECTHNFISNRIGDVRPNCSGRLVDGYQAKVVDAAGLEVPDGEPGILMVKGGSICTFYWRQPQRTREAIIGEWFRSGDTYVRDPSGYFYYQGRSDDMLKVGGIWVSPYEVEAVLDEHEAVLECAVIGVLDQDGLVKPEAFVVAEGRGGQALEASLKQFVRRRLGGNKTPRAFNFVDSLPKTATGKVQRFKLREIADRGRVTGT
jgi:benzoate-CoA ligase family protein